MIGELDLGKILDQKNQDKKDILKANQTIITLCNYITKLTDDEKALKRARTEIKKAQKVIDRHKSFDRLIDKIVEINCKQITLDPDLTEEEKLYHINGIQKVHQQYGG